MITRVNRHLEGLRDPTTGKSDTGNKGRTSSPNKRFTSEFSKLQEDMSNAAYYAAIDKVFGGETGHMPKDKVQVKLMEKQREKGESPPDLHKLSCNAAHVSYAALRKAGATDKSVDDVASAIVSGLNERLRDHDTTMRKLDSISCSGNGFITIGFKMEPGLIFDHGQPNTPSDPSATKGRTHQLRVQMVRAQYEEESYQLFRKYQMRVHGEGPDEVSKKGYNRFLVESPLIAEAFDRPLPEAPVTGSQRDASNPSILEVLETKFIEQGLPRSAIRFCVLMLDGELHAVGAALDELATHPTDKVLPLLEHIFGPIPQECKEDINAIEFYQNLDQQQRKLDKFIVNRLQRVQDELQKFKEDSVELASKTGFKEQGQAVSVELSSVLEDINKGMGSFHQKYYYDDKLIAVGVVDVLPKCLSSVYLFYDPDFHWLELGKYSALREIQWVQEVAKTHPHLHYYYMGYYIHSCQKMRYKGQYYPSELLCPETHHWIRLEKLVHKLNEEKYFQFSSEAATEMDNYFKSTVPRLYPFFLELHQLKPVLASQLANRGKQVVLELLRQLYQFCPELLLRVLVKFN